MEQITVKFEDAIFEKIKIRMEKNGCKTLSQCARELVELALRIEEAAAKQGAGDGENDVFLTLINLLKTNMIWSLETRFFVKFLMENWNQLELTQLGLFMEKAKERAAAVVGDLLTESKKPSPEES